MGTSLHLLHPMTMQQVCELACHSILVWGKVVSSTMKGLQEQVADLGHGIAITLDNAAFGDADDATRSADPLVLVQEFRPFPCAQVAGSQPLVHQVKGARGKFEQAKSIHRAKAHAVPQPLLLGVGLGIGDHAAAHVYSHKLSYRWIVPG